MKNKKTIIIITVIVVMIIAGCWIFGGAKAKNKVDFATEKAQTGSVSNSITATGTIEPVTEVDGIRIPKEIIRTEQNTTRKAINQRYGLRTIDLRLPACKKHVRTKPGRTFESRTKPVVCHHHFAD